MGDQIAYHAVLDAEEAERSRRKREFANLAITLVALFLSIFTVWVTHRDSSEALKQNQRVYVAPELVGDDKKALIRIRASGQTPALDVKVSATFVILWSDSQEEERAQETKPLKDSDLATAVENALFLPGATLDLITINKDNRESITRGWVTYKDVFGDSHKTDFCFHGREYCKQGNDAN
jgi:hypothetical protein